MTEESQSDRIVKQDEALLELLGIARAFPEKLRQASARSMARVNEESDRSLKENQGAARQERATLQEAFDLVRSNAKDLKPRGIDESQFWGYVDVLRSDEAEPKESDPITAYIRAITSRLVTEAREQVEIAMATVLDEQKPLEDRRVRPEVEDGDHPRTLYLERDLREYEQKHGTLSSLTAEDAYGIVRGETIEQYAERCAGELRGMQDPELASPTAPEVPYQLAIQTLGLMRQECDKIRTQEEWWEVLFLVMCMEYPEMPPEELGLEPEDLPWGDEGDDEDLFGHRDQMRSYLGMGPEDDEEQKARRTEAFWLLARRAAVHLGSQQDGDVRVKDRHLNCLQALRELKATTEATRSQAKEVASRAEGVDDESRVKRTLANLSAWGYVRSKVGRGGGSWSTPAGVKLLEDERPLKQ